MEPESVVPQQPGIVPTAATPLARTTAASLATRGLQDLRARQEAWSLWEEGRRLVSANLFAEALNCFERASSVQPEDADWQWQWSIVSDFQHILSHVDPAALNWYRVGAERGISWTQCHLGQAYCFGIGVEQDYGEALKWYARAAVQNWPEAQLMTGWLYHSGHGAPQNIELAIYWYKEAASVDHHPAARSARIYLGDIYSAGDGVLADPVAANFWYEGAFVEYQDLADQGRSDAQYALASMYELGKGTEVNPEMAAKLYSRAAGNGEAPAKAGLDRARDPA